jgi:hypothetical protein
MTRVLHWDGQSWTSEALSKGYDRQLAVIASLIWITDRNGSIFHKAR